VDFVRVLWVSIILMDFRKEPPMDNRLPARLPGEEFDALLPYFKRVSLRHGEHVIILDEPIGYIYFPLNCLLSLVTMMEDGSSAESGSIGREGMSGIPRPP
jgi:hypothetical protein